MNKVHKFGLVGAVYGFVAVALGAFGAHALEAHLDAQDSLDAWKTAVDYQMWHALALILGAGLSTGLRAPRPALWLFSLGIFFFSGSIYGLSTTDIKWLWPFTPIGGSLLLAGWATWGWSLLRRTDDQAST